MAKKQYTKEELRKHKTDRQREYRAQLLSEGKNPYLKPKLSEEVKEANKVTRKQRQREWFLTEEGKAFIKRQADRRRKYDSPQERDSIRNERRKLRLKTDLEYNLKYRLHGCKDRARRDNLEFDLDLEHLKEVYTETCPYLGIKLNLMATSGNSMDALSVDRIVPSLGYVKGNVQIISYKANVMKQDVDIETLVLFAKNVLERHGEK